MDSRGERSDQGKRGQGSVSRDRDVSELNETGIHCEGLGPSGIVAGVAAHFDQADQ
jgi:hypothetical protein